jgi:hypothetical protein
VSNKASDKAYDFFVAFGRAHGAEIMVDGERLDRPDEDVISDFMQADYPSFDSLRPHSDFPIVLTFPFRSSVEPNAPELATVSAQIEQIRGQLKDLGYDADPNRFSGWSMARGVHGIHTSHGPQLRGSAIQITVQEPPEPTV